MVRTNQAGSAHAQMRLQNIRAFLAEPDGTTTCRVLQQELRILEDSLPADEGDKLLSVVNVDAVGNGLIWFIVPKKPLLVAGSLCRIAEKSRPGIGSAAFR